MKRFISIYSSIEDELQRSLDSGWICVVVPIAKLDQNYTRKINTTMHLQVNEYKLHNLIFILEHWGMGMVGWRK